MDGQSKRRSVRNRTIAIDTKAIFVDNACAESEMKIEPRAQTMSVIDTRSYAFKDLISAFHMIEKRSCQDPREAFKRFKLSEDQHAEYYNQEVFYSFPKISENPFIRNEQKNLGSISEQCDPPHRRCRQVRFDTNKQ